MDIEEVTIKGRDKSAGGNFTEQKTRVMII